MSYRVVQCQVARGNFIYDYCDSNARLAKLLYNSALFRIRQVFTGYDRDCLSDNQKQVFAEIAVLKETFLSINVSRVISYAHLEKLMRATHNPDFFAGLPMQSAQAVLKQAVSDFKNWLSALRDYRKNPSKYLGKPKMPHYQKNDSMTFTFTNQDAVLYFTDKGTLLKFPLLKERLFLPNIEKGSVLKEVKVKPFYDRYIISLTLEINASVARTASEMSNICAVDFGVDNFATIVCNDNSSRLYKGGAVLSNCQWFYKSRAKAVRIITKGRKSINVSSRYINALSVYHYNFVHDQCHKISRSIVRYCIEHRAGTIVLGTNKHWKQNTNIGKQNNQNFVSMPVAVLKDMIAYKASEEGIRVIMQEESYTSKADITSMDYIPTYGVDDDKADFSGSRIKRGLYKCANGLIINADCNDASNIMRKAFADAWKDTHDFSFLAEPEVYGFHELNPQSNPVEGIVAV